MIASLYAMLHPNLVHALKSVERLPHDQQARIGIALCEEIADLEEREVEVGARPMLRLVPRSAHPRLRAAALD